MAEQIDIDIAALTPQIKFLVDAIGITQTYRFLSAFGGQRVMLPLYINNFEHPIALILGLDDANKLCYFWKQTHHNHCRYEFDVPVLDTLLLQIRRKKICELAKNHTINEIAKEMSISRKWVMQFIRNYCTKDLKENIPTKSTKTTQLDLFENIIQS